MRRTIRAAAVLASAGALAAASACGEPPAEPPSRVSAFAATAAPDAAVVAPYLPGSAQRAQSSVGGRSVAVEADPAPASTARYPGDLLDLRNWYLTLPSGDEQPALTTYSSRWFGLDAAKGGVVFTANAGGATTSGSSYPRSELREMNGGEKAAWSSTRGTHTLEVRQAVLAVPPAKPEVVTAQIHDGSDDVMEVRLEGERLIAQYDDGGTDITIDPSYVLGTPFNLRIVAAGGRIDVFYNGVRRAQIPRSGSEWYFKTGTYLQSNTEKGDRAEAVARVALYSLRVTHSG
jgi:Alginate lyase